MSQENNTPTVVETDYVRGIYNLVKQAIAIPMGLYGASLCYTGAVLANNYRTEAEATPLILGGILLLGLSYYFGFSNFHENTPKK